MFIIWRRRKREHYGGDFGDIEVGDVRLTPVVVESRRVNGKPKQEHIAVLPSFIESQTSSDNTWYWAQVEKKLARLSLTRTAPTNTPSPASVAE